MLGAILLGVFAGVPALAAGAEDDLGRRFAAEVRPFVEAYCVSCHDDTSREADLDLSAFDTLEAVTRDHPRWAAVLERLRDGDMPPRKAKKQPQPEARSAVIAWIETLRDAEARRNAGDPGPVPARRLSNSEYDRTIHEITGMDLRPTRDFPVDPANQAGFDNSAESLAMSPALVKKYLQAARTVSEHLALTPDGFAFAPHPVVADTDRDKWAVLRIVEFYRRQPTDYADYFEAAWRFKHRSQLGSPDASLAEVAAQSGVSAKYLATIWAVLEEEPWEVGPIADLQVRWRQLPPPVPPPGEGAEPEVREGCEALRDSVVQLRSRIVPEVKNLSARPIQEGSQTLVMWKNRQMAANRRQFDPAALISAGETNVAAPSPVSPPPDPKPAAAAPARRGTNRVQAPTPGIVQRGGLSLPPAILTTGTSATAQMAGARRGAPAPELVVPDDPAVRARHEAAFARFAGVFPDAFYITERARVYLDAEKEQENAGRLLSAGLHSMTGYFRDDRPLYDMILDEAGQRELDRLWEEFDLVSSVPQRMHTSFVWFERTDSVFLRDAEFDPYRPEDKSVTSQEKIRSLAELYLAKARRHQASETVQQAIQEHFDLVAANMARVERVRAAAEPLHRAALEAFATRAYRRSLTAAEREELGDFYRRSREENGVDHEEAMRDGIARVLMSPSFLFRMDLVDASAAAGSSGALAAGTGPAGVPLSDDALASRLSYFLWNGPPDEPLRAAAAAGRLRSPDGIQAQARRLLKDPRIRYFATEFAGQWLDFRRFEEHNSVDRERFPAFDNELRAALFEEPVRLFTDVLQQDRPVLDLLYARDTFVNGVLARHYGLPADTASEADWTRVADARAYGRGGLLPMGVFLTANSPGLRTSPVKRGYWVVRRLLGERIPPPPATVPELPGDEKQLGELTLREALARHRRDEACAGCHARFDSFGLVFEGYGPVGERRAVDLGGRPVDTTAEFPDGSSHAGLEGLLEYVRAHREQDFVDNLCRKLLAYGLSRTLILSDEPLVSEMKRQLADGGGRFGALIESVVTSPQFLNTRGRGDLARQ